MKHSDANRITRFAPILSSKGLITSRLIANPRNELPNTVPIISPERSASIGSSSSPFISSEELIRTEFESAAVNSASTQIQKIDRRS